MGQSKIQLTYPVVISYNISSEQVDEEDRCVLHKIMLRNIAKEKKTKKFVTISSFLMLYFGGIYASVFFLSA